MLIYGEILLVGDRLCNVIYGEMLSVVAKEATNFLVYTYFI